MGKILTFSPKRPKVVGLCGSRCIVADDLHELVSYLHRGIEKWRQDEANTSSDPIAAAELEKAGNAVAVCLNILSQSAGQWRGEWPDFANVSDASILARCAEHVYWSLSRLLLDEFAPKVTAGLENSAANNTPLKFNLRYDLTTFLFLQDFVHQLIVELNRQSLAFNRIHRRRTQRIRADI